jgi:hypothetical protein
MKSAIITIIALTAPVLTAPIFPAVTIQLSNDLTGANADAKLLADGTFYAIADLFDRTPININDTSGEARIIVSSAQLTQFPEGVFCIIKDDNMSRVSVLNFMSTFTDLAKAPNGQLLDVTEAHVNCQI